MPHRNIARTRNDPKLPLTAVELAEVEHALGRMGLLRSNRDIATRTREIGAGSTSSAGSSASARASAKRRTCTA